MAVNMVLGQGVCACCGKKQTLDINQTKIDEGKVLDILNYFDLKFIRPNICENCGYVAEDLTKLIGTKTKAIVKSKEYQASLDNGFMQGFEDVPYQEYEDYYVGCYDAMSLLYRLENIENFTYAKVLNQIATLKKTLCGVYFENKIDKDSEKWNPIYENLINHLSNQSKNAFEECIRVLKNINLDSPYKVIFAAEILSSVYKYKQARELIESLKDYTIDEDLQEYIDEFLTEVERV